MIEIQVRLSDRERSYPVKIGEGLLATAASHIKAAAPAHRRALIVTQKAIAKLHLEGFVRSLAKENIEAIPFYTPEGKSSEAAKSQAVFLKLIRQIACLDGENRVPILIALGGGVIGDLTGFAAAVYRRGIPYIQVPTTLTAQTDSAIGGKTAIDLPEGKNLLGCVYQPRLVLADTSLLSTLPERFWSDGFAEIIKYGVIDDPRLFEELERKGRDAIRNNKRLLAEVIARCVRIKARCVEEDEFDKKGKRIILNFGHTAGHGIEAASQFSNNYTHGEAVGVGMLVACDLGVHTGVLKDPALTSRIEKLLIKFGLPVFFKGIQLSAVIKAMGYDKKGTGDKNRFVLPVSLGRVRVYEGVPASAIESSLEKRKA